MYNTGFHEPLNALIAIRGTTCTVWYQTIICCVVETASLIVFSDHTNAIINAQRDKSLEFVTAHCVPCIIIYYFNYACKQYSFVWVSIDPKVNFSLFSMISLNEISKAYQKTVGNHNIRYMKCK